MVKCYVPCPPCRIDKTTLTRVVDKDSFSLAILNLFVIECGIFIVSLSLARYFIRECVVVTIIKNIDKLLKCDMLKLAGQCMQDHHWAILA